MKSKLRKTAGFTAAAVTTLAAVAGIAGADAPDTAKTCVEFQTRFVRTATVDHETRPVSLPAGRYLVAISTSDGYKERPTSPASEQDSERVSVLGIVSDDLVDGVEAASAVSVGTVVVATDLQEVTAFHVHGDHGWQSVKLDAVCFSRVPDAPTPVAPTPTTQPVVPPTTQPVVPPTTTKPAGPPATTPTTPALPGLPVLKDPHFNG